MVRSAHTSPGYVYVNDIHWWIQNGRYKDGYIYVCAVISSYANMWVLKIKQSADQIRASMIK